MNLKKFISLLFVLLLGAGSVAFAANNTRNVYSVYSDNFSGAHGYGYGQSVASDYDAVENQHWQYMNCDEITNDEANAPEGKTYIRCGVATNVSGWAGRGYAATNSGGVKDMRAYKNGSVKFLARTSSSNMADFVVGIKVNDREYSKKMGDFANFSSNGDWVEYTLPLTEGGVITDSNLQNTNILFMFLGGNIARTAGKTIDFDNIRWVKNNAGATFSIVRKNTSDNSEVSDQSAPISFSEDYYGQGWVVADQYLEMDIDGELTGNNWVVRVCTNNDIAGLYNISDTSDVLPTAWKVSCSTLPYVYTDYDSQGNPFQNKNTLEIGENKSQSGEFYGLYDAGKVAYLHDDGVKWLYPWFFVKASGDTSAKSIILNDKGCHTFENTDAGGIVHQYYDGFTYFHERKPKLFFACDTKKAIAAKYTASFTISLSYE